MQRRVDDARLKLMAYFAYNYAHTDARHIAYQDFPTYIVWKGKEKAWSPRQQGTAVGRIYSCNPLVEERYYLRMLLTIVPGPTSFEDLRTHHGIIYPTFKAACSARGLLEDDQEWIACFTEAIKFASGHALRSLFGLALVHGSVTDPCALWGQFCDSICDDLPNRLKGINDIPSNLLNPHLDYGLYLLNQVLLDLGKHLADFYLPIPIHDWGQTIGNPLIQSEMDYNPRQEQRLRDEKHPLLNSDQKLAFDTIVSSITNNPQEAHFFLHGPAGTGKTFLYSVLCNHFRAQRKIVLCVASSGIATLLFPGGQSSHSRFKIPIVLHEDSGCNITRNTHLYNLLQKTSLIIWDEVPMQHKYCFHAVHRTFSDLLDEEGIFGGIPIVMGGDFAQILPVIPRGSRHAIVNANIQCSFLWPQFRKLFLQQNMRIRNMRRMKLLPNGLKKYLIIPHNMVKFLYLIVSSTSIET